MIRRRRTYFLYTASNGSLYVRQRIGSLRGSRWPGLRGLDGVVASSASCAAVWMIVGAGTISSSISGSALFFSARLSWRSLISCVLSAPATRASAK